MNLRRPSPVRNLRQGIEDRNHEASRTSYLEDLPAQEMLEQYIPQIAEETQQAVKTERTDLYYYRKKLFGRRCSCFDIETSPEALCQICFGSGIVGGWDLHGCRTEIIDTTCPKLKMINVEVDYVSGQRPLTFRLTHGSLKGYIETEIPLVVNIKKTQLLQEICGGLQKGNSLKSFIKEPKETNYVELTQANLNKRLGSKMIKVKIELKRNSVEIPSPRLSHLMIRYLQIPEYIMYADMNLSDETFSLGDLGFTDSFSQVTAFFPKAFDNLRTEDFFIRLNDKKRFKVNGVNRNALRGILTSTTVTSRLLIRGNDALVNFP